MPRSLTDSSGQTPQPPQPPPLRIPTGLLTLFAIPLGLAGLGGVWAEAQTVVGAPTWPAHAIYALSGVFWLSLTVVYLARSMRRGGALGEDLRNPAAAPLLSYPPVIGLLYIPHLNLFSHSAAEWACGVFAATQVLVVSHLLTSLFKGNVPLSAVHPGYFLPYVAGASITGIGLAGIGARTAATTAIGTGLFFWVVISALFFTRLATQEKLPSAVKPLFSVLLASPATAGIAWFASHGTRTDPVIDALVGVIIVLVLVQFMLFRDYVRVGFTLGFWAFAFPVASTTNFAMRWLTAVRVENLQEWSWALTSFATLCIAALGARSLLLVLENRRGPRT